MSGSESPIAQGAQSAENSIRNHIRNTKSLAATAENFLSGAENLAELTVSAENFVNSASDHVKSVKMLAATAEDHVSKLGNMMSSAEAHVQGISKFIGAETSGNANVATGAESGAESNIKGGKKYGKSGAEASVKAVAGSEQLGKQSSLSAEDAIK